VIFPVFCVISFISPFLCKTPCPTADDHVMLG
jgi:hypothetical protein